MFESVRSQTDPEQRRRSAWSVIGMVALFGSVAFVSGLGLFETMATESDRTLHPDEPIGTMVEADDAIPLPDLPPPPPPARGGSISMDLQPIELDDAIDVIAELDKPVEELRNLEPIVAVDGVADDVDEGSEHGVDGGQAGGVEGGTPGGSVGGAPGGTGHGGPAIRTLRVGQLQKKFGPLPRYPRAAALAGLSGEVCTVKVQISAKGVPTQADVTGCSEVFKTEALRTIMRWKWYPHREGRMKIPVQSTLRFRFQPD